MTIFLLISCLAVVLYVYAGYPLLLKLRAFGRRPVLRPTRVAGSLPRISIIIPAYNEESSIEAKLRNVLASDYPGEMLEVLVGSDGSTDRTASIVAQYAHRDVKLVSFASRHGKSAIQNALVAASSGSILVFTDADCLFSREAIRRVVAPFTDPRVGLVAARPSFVNPGETSITSNEDLYLRYENWLRRRESEAGILAMASGALFCLRRSVWRPLDPGLSDDFVLPLRAAAAGLRNILVPGLSVTTRIAQSTPASMFRAKVRIISKDFRALLLHRGALNVFRRPALALSLFSHKLLRWLVPYFLLVAFAANLVLALQGSTLGRASFCLQLAFYALALCGLAIRGRHLPFPLSVPASFCVVNCAALVGTLKCLLGRRSGSWTPERSASRVAPLPRGLPTAAAKGR